MADNEVEERLLGPWPAKMTHSSAPSLDALKRELHETRERKFSIDDGQIREGMHCFGAPVFDAQNVVVAGIAVSLLTHDLSPETIQNAGAAMQNLANQLSSRLGSSRTN